MHFICLGLFLTTFVSAFGDNVVPIVKTTFGAVQGIYEQNTFGEFYLYMGIPYGQLPKGNLFGDSVDPQPWNGTFNASTDNIKCPQRDELSRKLEGNPNCLILNVYVPANRSSTESLPVLFWIYGGGLMFGYSGRYMWGPEFLVQHNIIMVTVNYRLGPYGFMCLGDDQVPGNAGLKDVLKGLRWVKKNIASFGGNAEKITVGGSSAGSMIAESLIVSPAANGLFHRAILESGSAIVMEYWKEPSHEKVLKLARVLGFKKDSVKEAMQYLQSVDHLKLLTAVEDLKLSFTFCAEPIIEGIEQFLPKSHIETLKNMNYKGVDILIGMNEYEIVFDGNITKGNIDNLVHNVLFAYGIKEKTNEISKIIREFYLGTEPTSSNQSKPLTALQGDFIITYPVIQSLEYLTQKNITAYLYKFNHSGKRNYGQYVNRLTWDSAVHADEIGYLFNQGLWGEEINGKDKVIMLQMTTMWTNFIKFGNPTPNKTALHQVKWLPVEKNKKLYLNIATDNITMEIDPHRERMAFWELLSLYSLDSNTPLALDTTPSSASHILPGFLFSALGLIKSVYAKMEIS